MQVRFQIYQETILKLIIMNQNCGLRLYFKTFSRIVHRVGMNIFYLYMIHCSKFIKHNQAINENLLNAEIVNETN